MQEPFVFIMLGFVGSGKSHVSEWLAKHLGAVHLRADDLRLAMFGDNPREMHTRAKTMQVVSSGAYFVQQILASGTSVVQDANHNTLATRREVASRARNNGGTPIIIWVKTPLEIAEERAAAREAAGGLKMFDEGLVRRFARNFQEPASDELVIVIDGQHNAKQQRESFAEQFAALTAQP